MMPVKSQRNSFFLAYLIFGGLSMLFNIFVFKIMFLWVSYQVANIIAIIMTKVFVFVTNKKYVFNSPANRRELLPEILRFIIAQAEPG